MTIKPNAWSPSKHTIPATSSVQILAPNSARHRGEVWTTEFSTLVLGPTQAIAESSDALPAALSTRNDLHMVAEIWAYNPEATAQDIWVVEVLQ